MLYARNKIIVTEITTRNYNKNNNNNQHALIAIILLIKIKKKLRNKKQKQQKDYEVIGGYKIKWQRIVQKPLSVMVKKKEKRREVERQSGMAEARDLGRQFNLKKSNLA